jgi:hypothetical protein
MENIIEDVAVNLLRSVVVELPQDVKDALHRAYQEESRCEQTKDL